LPGSNLKEAAAKRFVSLDSKLLKKRSVSRCDTAALIEHKQRLFEAVYDTLCLDMIAAQKSVEVF
jgi:hypothetical protein